MKASPGPLLGLLALLTLTFGCATHPAGSLDTGNVTKPAFFPILPWDPYHGWNGAATDIQTNGLESIAECNFNLAGFVLPKDLPRCRKLGLGAIVLPVSKAFTNVDYIWQWKKLSDAEIDRRVKEMIEAAGSNPAVMGYFITDEPGVSDYPALAKAVAAVRKYAPGKLAYINLFPDYATMGAPDKSQLGTTNYTDYLERFVEEVKPQLLSYDNYKVAYSGDLDKPAEAASYYNNLLEIRRVAQRHHLPYLNIVLANQLAVPMHVPSPANLAFQAYTTLAAGYSGVTWYTYYGRGYQYASIDTSGSKTLTWSYLRDINGQVAALAPIMSRLTSTGVYFSAPALVPNLPLLPGNLIQSVKCSTPVMVGEFTHPNGQQYVMVVNLSLERSARFTVETTHPVKAISVISAADGSRSALDRKNGHWLVAGSGALLLLE